MGSQLRWCLLLMRSCMNGCSLLLCWGPPTGKMALQIFSYFRKPSCCLQLRGTQILFWKKNPQPYMQVPTLSETRRCRARYSTLLLGGGLFVLLSVWMLVGDTAAPRLPWGMPGIFPPGDTCIAASWAAYNCCKNKQKMGGGSGEREREEKHHQ